MMWSSTARRCGAAVALAATAVALLPVSTSAQSSRYERSLAGIRLNSRSSSVLRLYGNPNEVVIGDVSLRLPPTGGAGQGQGAPGSGFPGGDFPGGGPGFPGSGFPGSGFPGATPGFPGAPGGGFGAPPAAPAPMGMGAAAGVGPRGPAGPQGFGFGRQGGIPGGPEGGFGFPGAPDGGDFPGGPGFPGAPGGFPGGPGFPGAPGGPGMGMGMGPFGQTTSSLARQQEVTWIYNRKAGKEVVSYEFLIGPSGQVIQIRALGYTGSVRTSRGIKLGSDYRDVVRLYGYPESHLKSGNILVADYKNRAHVQFQFQNQRGQGDPLKGGYKVIAITIAAIE